MSGRCTLSPAVAGRGGEADLRDAMRPGVRVDPGGEEREVHEEVRPVTSVLAGVQVERSGLRGFGMAAARPDRPLGYRAQSGNHAQVTCRSAFRGHKRQRIGWKRKLDASANQLPKRPSHHYPV